MAKIDNKQINFCLPGHLLSMLLYRRYFRYLDFVLIILLLLCSPSLSKRKTQKGTKNKKFGRVKVSHDFNKHAKFNKAEAKFKAPQLTKRDKEYLSKLEDALQNKDGMMMYTNSWAVQLNPAEVAQADRIAYKHGFENLGQVRILNILRIFAFEAPEFSVCFSKR